MITKKRTMVVVLVLILILVATLIHLDRKPKEITLPETKVYYSEHFNGGMYWSPDELKKMEQEKTDAEVYMFRLGSNKNSSIHIKNKENVELVEIKKIKNTIYIEIKKSWRKRDIQGDKVGKVITIATEQSYDNVIVTKRGLFN